MKEKTDTINQAMQPRELVVAAFIFTLLGSNILAVKLIDIGPFVLPAAVILYPFCFMLGDVITEIWGFRYARQTILLGFAANFCLTFFLWLGGLLPPSLSWEHQAAYQSIFGLVPRIVLASFVAYLAGEIVNSYVLIKIREKLGPKRLYLRTIGSSLAGVLLDTAIFITGAFWGLLPKDMFLRLLIGQYITKITIEALLGTPLAYLLVGKIGNR